jgi:hypothetical protein
MRRIAVTLVLSLVAALGLGAAPAAAASGWTTIYGWRDGSVFLACKYAESGPYGPVWQVRLVLAQNPAETVVHLRAFFVVKRMGPQGAYWQVATTSLATDQVGQWDVRTATGSQLGNYVNGRWNADQWSWGIGDEDGGLGSTEPVSFLAINNC